MSNEIESVPLIEPDLFAKRLLQAHLGTAGPVAELSTDLQLEDAYAIQSHLMHALGPPGGFKTGRLPNGSAFVAPIRKDRVCANGASVVRKYRIGLELEVGFQLMRPIETILIDQDATVLSDYFRPLPVIELVTTRLNKKLHDDPMAKLADLQMNDGMVVGNTKDDWHGEDFTFADITLTVGDTPVFIGPADVPGGSALKSLRAFLRTIDGHCGGLQPGHVVITGSMSPLTYVEPDGPVEGGIDGLGQVSFVLG